MHDRFDLGLQFVLGEEIGPYIATGGYISPERAAAIHDAGGETYKGIARNRNPAWAGWAIIDRLRTDPRFPYNLEDIEVQKLSDRANSRPEATIPDETLQGCVRALYRERYWDQFHCFELPPGLDLAMFDAAVQHLPGTAIALIQHAVRVTADGKLGPVTFAAANKVPAGSALEAYLVQRAELYMDLIVADARRANCRDGWFARLFRLHAFILANPEGIP